MLFPDFSGDVSAHEQQFVPEYTNAARIAQAVEIGRRVGAQQELQRDWRVRHRESVRVVTVRRQEENQCAFQELPILGRQANEVVGKQVAFTVHLLFGKLPLETITITPPPQGLP